MAHHPCLAANYFINRGNSDGNLFTPLQIQKLIYFANGWMLGVYHRPLLDEEFEAWQYGPVIPVVYHNLSYYGGDSVPDPIRVHPGNFDAQENNILGQVFDLYGPLSGKRLVGLTHKKGSPWHTIWNRYKRPTLIPNKLVEDYFARQYNEHRKQQQRQCR